MSRLTITTTALAATAALALPGVAAAAPVDAAAHLEAHAVVDSAKALDQVRGNAAKAKRLIKRSELALTRAYRITRDEGLDASAKFAASAQAQGENLSAIVERSNGALKRSAAEALAQTTRLEADLVARAADGLDAQRESASASQSEDVSSLGADHASLTATIAVTASDAGLRPAVQREMDTATAASVTAQADLVEAVENLRTRSEAQGQASMVSLQASLERSGRSLADALERSGRWEVSYEKTIGTGEGPVAATATVQAHAVVDHGGRR
jgi:hypothetical protein